MVCTTNNYYSLRYIVIKSYYHFGTFHSNRVIFLFSKNQHIFSHILYSLLLYSLIISLPFSFSTLFSLYLIHLTLFFLISVPKRNASITMERREYLTNRNLKKVLFQLYTWADPNGGNQGLKFLMDLFFKQFSINFLWNLLIFNVIIV